eukprot:6176283-Pleurochrysis_carterae.AAC.1
MDAIQVRRDCPLARGAWLAACWSEVAMKGFGVTVTPMHKSCPGADTSELRSQRQTVRDLLALSISLDGIMIMPKCARVHRTRQPSRSSHAKPDAKE